MTTDKLVITIELHIGDELEAFLPLMAANAAASLRGEPGCRYFDVCEDATDPHRLFLYEVYDSEDAFAAHLASPHYKAFDAQTASMIKRKDVRRLWLKAG